VKVAAELTRNAHGRTRFISPVGHAKNTASQQSTFSSVSSRSSEYGRDSPG